MDPVVDWRGARFFGYHYMHYIQIIGRQTVTDKLQNAGEIFRPRAKHKTLFLQTAVPADGRVLSGAGPSGATFTNMD